MALVSQNNIPQSGQIQKPKGNPELGNSHIQNSLGTPPSQGTIDNFENPTKKSTWKSENKEIEMQNGTKLVHYESKGYWSDNQNNYEIEFDTFKKLGIKSRRYTRKYMKHKPNADYTLFYSDVKHVKI